MNSWNEIRTPSKSHSLCKYIRGSVHSPAAHRPALWNSETFLHSSFAVGTNPTFACMISQGDNRCQSSSTWHNPFASRAGSLRHHWLHPALSLHRYFWQMPICSLDEFFQALAYTAEIKTKATWVGQQSIHRGSKKGQEGNGNIMTFFQWGKWNCSVLFSTSRVICRARRHKTRWSGNK